jgi:hemerythrin-like domain-containing protein
MAEAMSMNRVIHGAVRRDLARFLQALDTFPDGNQARAGQLGKAWDFFYNELDYHHHGEHAIAWPALRSVGAEDALLAQMDAEHDKLAEALAAAGDKIKALAQSPTKAAANDAHSAMAALRDVAEEHLSHEERDVDPIYVANSGGPEMKEMGRKFSRDRSPRAAGEFFAWVQNGASTEERAGLRSQVPPLVLFVLSRLVGRRYGNEIAPIWR